MSAISICGWGSDCRTELSASEVLEIQRRDVDPDLRRRPALIVHGQLGPYFDQCGSLRASLIDAIDADKKNKPKAST